MDPSLRPLLDVTSTLEFEEFGWLKLQSAEWDERDLSLRLMVHLRDQPEEWWRIRCVDVRDSQLGKDGTISDIYIETEHPLLLPHVSTVAELYFRGRPADPDAVVGQLVEAHRAVVGDWFSFTQFFNLGPSHAAIDAVRRLRKAGGGSATADRGLRPCGRREPCECVVPTRETAGVVERTALDRGVRAVVRDDPGGLARDKRASDR